MAATTGLEHMICFELYATSRAITARYRPFLDEAGLTYPQYLVLCVLWHRGPVTVRDLGHALHLDSGTLSPLLKRLESHGHLRRERGTADERTVVVHPTESAQVLRLQLADLPRQVAQEAAQGAGLTLDELRQLHHLLQRVTPA
ncbi:MarR family winged helix-turn-helix transcriptional regulator [Paractinoplanes rishiriensis]|uniref:MarR family transcriptional regulator n=1 Tax=Paractinoplanes rishiriensis TaxID=1050105 RepID=A0A919K556_9ACTN|nr:MarR family transcriptional regulator [Actinoplanes rishiriensis]GIE98763.1 MarR family transcriptional regulator [Actinoplanes rishiriensis]